MSLRKFVFLTTGTPPFLSHRSVDRRRPRPVPQCLLCRPRGMITTPVFCRLESVSHLRVAALHGWERALATCPRVDQVGDSSSSLMNQLLPLDLVVACAAGFGVLAPTLVPGGEGEGQPRATSPASSCPESSAAQRPASSPSRGEVAPRSLGAFLGEVADPWLGVFAQLAAFTLFVLWLKRWFPRSGAGRPARRRKGENPGQTLPAGYRAHFPAPGVTPRRRGTTRVQEGSDDGPMPPFASRMEALGGRGR
jgi:hypothetical protein